jgi:hypothetical protein
MVADELSGFADECKLVYDERGEMKDNLIIGN